jgi:2-C-methyl-D-erythritol 4-phosphate cytidylyltransferase
MARVALIIPAAGSGSRFGGPVRKPFADLAGRAILLRTFDRFAAVEQIRQRILVVAPADLDLVRETYGNELSRLGVDVIIPGGKERYDSVRAGLDLVRDECDLVAIHDAVRPLVPLRAVAEALRLAEQIGAACVGVPVHDTVKRADANGIVLDTPPRDGLWQVQTPQVFRTGLIRQAYERLDRFRGKVTDDSQLVEALGHPVVMVEGGRENLKITTPADLALAEAWLRAGGAA